MKDGYGDGEIIYDVGCLVTMKQWFTNNLYTIGGGCYWSCNCPGLFTFASCNSLAKFYSGNGRCGKPVIFLFKFIVARAY